MGTRRFWLFAFGILVAGGLGAFGMYTASHSEGSTAAALYSGSMVAIVVGILFMLAGLQKTEGPAFDPGARINEYPWSNDEQAWTLGEALGMSLWTLKRSGGKLALLALPLPILLFGGSITGALLAPQVSALLTTTTIGRLPSEGIRPAVMAQGLAAAGGWIFVSLGIVLVMGPVIKLCLATLRAEKVTLGEALPGFKHVPRLLVFAVLWLLVFVITIPALGMPAMPLLLAPFYIVDQDLPLFVAMRKSWRVGSHHFGKLWLLNIAFIPLRLTGELSVIGMVFTIPLVLAGLAYAYVRLTGRVGMPHFPPEAGSRFIRSFLRNSLLALTALFAVQIYWVESLPKMRGSAWNVRDAAIRASAIVTQVHVVVVMFALILPYVLDQLEGRRFTTFVAARHVRSQKSGFLTVISVLSICGVAISSCALSSVVSVMGGFSQDLRRKILGSGAHIVVDTQAGTTFEDYTAALEKIRGIKGVVGATPVVRGEVMASSASNLAGVVVTGVVPGSIHSVIDLATNIEVGRLNYLEHPELLTKLPANEVIGLGPGGERYYKGAELPGLPDDIDPAVRAAILPSKPDRPGLILGRELAKTLHVYIGDDVTLVSPLGDLGPMGVMPRTKKFRVAAIFYSGMYEYDATYVYTMMDVAQEYFQTHGKISALEIKVDDAERADLGTPEVIAALGRNDLRVRDWREINKNLFSALKLERFATFIILSLAIIVASFCIICTLLLMVTEKGKEIAILKAIGATDGGILRTFIIEGMIIGGIGMIFGVVTSIAFCTGVSWFGLLLDPEVYYIDKLPISVNAIDFAKVALAALTICGLSTIYPAYAASRLRPVDGLRDA
jgi:lipoprotein-releasing system permease protein